MYKESRSQNERRYQQQQQQGAETALSSSLLLFCEGMCRSLSTSLLLSTPLLLSSFFVAAYVNIPFNMIHHFWYRKMVLFVLLAQKRDAKMYSFLFKTLFGSLAKNPPLSQMILYKM